MDILRFLDHYEYGISVLSGKCINWVVTNMERAIESRKEQLKRQKPGAVVPSEPKFIWVKMFNKVNGQSKMLAVRKRYNNVLEDILATRKHHYIMDVNEVMAKTDNFTSNNFINVRGKETFWREIDRQLELFDMQCLSLKPQARSTPDQGGAGVETEYKMPPPPPERRAHSGSGDTSFTKILVTDYKNRR